MDPKLVSCVTPLPMAPIQRSTLLDHGALERQTEAALQKLVDAKRAEAGLTMPGVVWDATLGHLLSPALASYETEAASGCAIGSAHFADAIRRFVPSGHTFKGFPHHFATADPSAIFAAWCENDVARDILTTRTKKATLSVRLRVFPLADEVLSVWAMLAIAYRPA